MTPWFIAFCDADSVWWHRWLKRGFQHCWAFRCEIAEDGSPRWLVMDPAFEGVQVRLAQNFEIEGWLLGAKLGRMTVLRMQPPGDRLVRPRWLLTCAGACAAVLGLRQTPITPWGLAKRLLRAGAKDVGEGWPIAIIDPAGPGLEGAALEADEVR